MIASAAARAADPGTPAANATTHTITGAIRAASAALTQSDTPRLDAEVLLAHVRGVDRARLLADGRATLAPADRDAFAALVARRAAGEPVAHLTGRAWFYGLALDCTPAALIPRPETELLAEWAIGWLRSGSPDAAGWTGRRPARVLDVGTGTGALALAIAGHTDSSVADIVATDIDAGALALARRNAARLGLADRVRFEVADLLPADPSQFDLVAANLPYVGTDESEDVDPSVLAHEPHGALFAGPDGLAEIRRLLERLPSRLGPGGAAGLEIGWRQGGVVVDLARAAFPAARVERRRDWAGLDRLILIQA